MSDPTVGMMSAATPAHLRAELAEKLLQMAVGPVIYYLWGGVSPKTGMDCSGLVMWLCSQLSVPLPMGRPNTDMLWTMLERVDSGSEEGGDLALYGSGDVRDPANHVMVRLADGRVAGMSGGGSRTTSIAIAKQQNARLKIQDSHLYRKDFIGWRRLPLNLAPGVTT